MRIRTQIEGDTWFTTDTAEEGEKARLIYHVPVSINVVDIPTHEPKLVTVKVIVAWPENAENQCTMTGELDWTASADVAGVLKSHPVQIFMDGVEVPTVSRFAATFAEEALQFFFS